MEKIWGDGWYTILYSFTIEPNPIFEDIYIKFSSYPAYVDQVVIDTHCVPEPTTILLIAGGIVGLVLRKRC